MNKFVSTDIECLKTVNSLHELAISDVSVKLSLKEGSLQYDYLYNPSNRKALIIFFPAAQEPPRREPPYFMRWSYGDVVPCDTLCVADPTAYLASDILGGWLLGTENEWAMLEIIKHIQVVIEQKKYANIIFSGSSMGGFNAIQACTILGSKLRGSVNCFFIAENSQISLLDYLYQGPMDLLAKTVWNVKSLLKIPKNDIRRINTVELMISENYTPYGYAIFKESDDHHFDVHKKILSEHLQKYSSKRIEIIEIPLSEDTTGHTPLNMQRFLDLVNKILNNSV